MFGKWPLGKIPLATLPEEDAGGVDIAASITEAADTLVSTATAEVQASAAVTEAADTLQAAATAEVKAETAASESADTLQSTAGHGYPEVVATAAITEASDTAQARFVNFILPVGQPAEEKKRRRKRQRQTIEKLLDHAIESTFEHFAAREDIKREIEAPKPKRIPKVEYPIPPNPDELAALAAMQAELDRMRADLPAVARAIRQQREEEDIELLLMSL